MASVTPLESFNHLTDNLPSWLTKIDELTVQVAEQNARFIRASQFGDHIIKRKHNSTESLRANANDGGIPEPPSDLAMLDVPANAYNPPNPSYKCISGVSHPKIAGTTNAHLIQELKRKRKPGSDTHSATSGRPRYRTKSMVVVYYDGAIQDAFENIVRSVAGARNNLRKGKVTANFKARMASMGLEDNAFSIGGEFSMLNPKLMRHGFTRTRMSPDIDGTSGAKLGGFDDADRDLEAVQNLCEVGAHQFLREGDCRLEIEGMRKHLQHVLELALKEVERLTLEDNEEKEAKRQKAEMENKEEMVAEQHKENVPMVRIDEKKLEPSIEISPAVKEIHFTGTGTIEVDDGSDAESRTRAVNDVKPQSNNSQPGQVSRSAPVKEPLSNRESGTSSIEATSSLIHAGCHNSKQLRSKTTEAQKEPQPKAKILPQEAAPTTSEVNWNIDTSSIISFSSRTRGQLKNSEVIQSPSLKRRRLFHEQGRAQPVFSQKWYPMDDMMSAKQSPKGKAKACSSQEANEVKGHVLNKRDNIDAYDVDSDTEGGDPTAVSEGNENSVGVTSGAFYTPKPNRRRSIRTSSQANAPNYDMRFHPAYDKACRPAAARAATIRQSVKQKPPGTSKDTHATLVENTAVTVDDDVVAHDHNPITVPSSAPRLSYSKLFCVAIPELPDDIAHPVIQNSQSSKALISSPPPWSNLQDPHVIPGPLDYQKLGLLDRLIYGIQKGAPSHGNTPPTAWQNAKRVLFDYGEITLDELKSEEATEWLKARYENVRRGVEAFYGIEGRKPSDETDWTPYRLEDFDVSDTQRGSRYWKHEKHSDVGPMTVNSSYRETGEVADSDDEANVYRVGHQFDIYEDADRSGSDAASPVEAGASGEDEDDITGDFLLTLPDPEAVFEIKEQTLLENMRGEDALSSEQMTDEEELGELLSPKARHPETSPLSYRHSPSAQLNPDNFHDAQSNNNEYKQSINKPPQPPTASTFQHPVQPIIAQYISDITRIIPSPPPPKLAPRKRKTRSETAPQVPIHEDLPGGSPEINRAIANNPRALGPDIPKENFCLNATNEHWSQDSLTGRQGAAVSSPTPFRYVARSSVFGGSNAPQYLGI